MENVKPLVVLVTGAGRGTGRQVADAFAADGAIVALNDIAPNNLEVMVRQHQERGHTVKAYIGDVAKKLSAQALINQVLDDWGRIDVLINHAVVEPAAPLLDMDEWDWHRTMDVNLTGAFLMMQTVGRIMQSQGGGVIINLISLSGRTGALNRSAYVASQMGIIGLTRQASRELFGDGVRVHAVGEGILRFQNAETTVPRELTRAVLFLASPRAAHLSGVIVDISR
jgi:NAD(P)-dependent dehydrogenase (short-subunit alcohol dehydrogenase family)